MAKSRSYQDDLFKALQDTEEARAYLNAALEDGNAQVFILALQDVLNAKINKMQQGNRMLIEFSNSEELGLKFDGQLRL